MRKRPERPGPNSLPHRIAASIAVFPLLFTLLGTTVVTLGTGCAAKTTTVTTERVNEKGEREVTTTTTESPRRPGGIISSVFGVVGDILAFPFRLVAGIVQVIF